MTLRWLFLLILVLATGPAYTQHIPVLRYNTSDGLGHPVVYRIYEDRHGFLWFSTDNGLTRYDGQYFRNFTSADGLRSNFVFDVLENDTSMVVATFGGGLQFTDGLQIDTTQRLGEAIRFPINLALDQDAIWVTDRTLDVYRVKSGKTKRYTSGILYPDKRVSVLLPSKEGMLVGTYGIYRYDATRDSLLSKNLMLEEGGKNRYVQNMIHYIDDQLIVNTGPEIVIINLRNGHVKTLISGNFSFSSRNLYLRRDGSLLVADADGNLWSFSPDLNERHLLLKDILINAMHEDRGGNLWLATSGQGVWCLPSQQVNVYNLPSLVNPTISYMPGRRQLFVSSQASDIIAYQHGRLFTPEPVVPGDFFMTQVFYVREVRHNAIMMAQGDGIVYVQGSEAKRISFKRPQTVGFQDHAGRLWAGMRMGLMVCDSTFEHHTEVAQFNNYIVRSVGEDGSGRILVGTHSGLFIQDGEAWRRYGKHQGLRNDYINDILYDKQRRLTWLATNEGITVLKDNGSVKNIYAGLRCNNMILDRRGNVWATTSAGLLYSNGLTTRLFSDREGVPDGLIELDYDPMGDTLYLLAYGKLAMFQTSGFLKEQSWVVPRLAVVEQLADGASLPFSKDTVTILPPQTSALRLRVSYPYFKTADRWRLYYRVNDKPWVNSGRGTLLNFVELGYGRTRIQLQLLDELGESRSEVLTLYYEVPTPWHQSIWLRVAMLVLLMVVCVVTVNLINRYFQAKRQRKAFFRQRQLELEQKVLSNMLNPHFLNNAINGIQLLVMKNDQRQTLRSLAKFARLMRVNLELLEKSMIPLEKELNNLSLYLDFEVVRFSGRLQYHIEVADDVRLSDTLVPSLVLQPFVENAIWHGILPEVPAGVVDIRVSLSGDVLQVTIDDNGIGIRASQQQRRADAKPSRGLALIRDRFDVLNQSHRGYSFFIEDKSDHTPPSSGTRVTITLPRLTDLPTNSEN